MAGREIKRRVRACPLDVLGGQDLPEGEFYRTSVLINFNCLVTARKCVPLVRDPMPSRSTGGNAMNRRLRSRLSTVVWGEQFYTDFPSSLSVASMIEPLPQSDGAIQANS